MDNIGNYVRQILRKHHDNVSKRGAYAVQHRVQFSPSGIDPDIHRRAKRRNRFNTWLIMGGLTLLLALSAWALFGNIGIFFAIALSIGLMVATPRISPALVLRLYKARPISPHELPELYRAISVLSARAGLPAEPRLFYVASSNMNAFAVGRPDASAISVTDGLLRGLNMRQLIGVMAHEISHIANDDLKVMGLADIVGRVTGLMQSAGIILLIIGIWQGWRSIIAALILMFAPAVGTLLQLALSRSREYDADLGAARLTGDPAGLASALRTLQRKQGAPWEGLFVPGGRVPDPSLLRTHPKVEDRVQRLLDLTDQDDPQMEEATEDMMQVPPNYRRVIVAPRYHISGFWY